MAPTRRGKRAPTLPTAAILGTGLFAAGLLETRAQHDLDRHKVVTVNPDAADRVLDTVPTPADTIGCTTDHDCRGRDASRILGRDVTSLRWEDLPQDLYPRIFDGITDPRTVHSDAYCLWAPDETTVVVCTDGTVVTS